MIALKVDFSGIEQCSKFILSEINTSLIVVNPIMPLINTLVNAA